MADMFAKWPIVAESASPRPMSTATHILWRRFARLLLVNRWREAASSIRPTLGTSRVENAMYGATTHILTSRRVGVHLTANYRFSTPANLDLTLKRVEKGYGYGRQLGGWKHRPVAFLGRQPRFTRQFEKDGRLDQVLVGEAVSAIVGHDRRPAGVRSAHFWGKRVELQCEQAEPADVRRPSPKMANQVFLEFVTGNLIAQMRESSSRLRDPAVRYVICGRQIRPVVVEEGAHVQEVMNVQPQVFQIARKLRWPVDISPDDVELGNVSFPEPLRTQPPSDFIEVGANDYEGMPTQRLAARALILGHVIKVVEKRPVAAAHIANPPRLVFDRPAEDLDHNLVDLLEVSLVGSAAAPNID